MDDNDRKAASFATYATLNKSRRKKASEETNRKGSMMRVLFGIFPLLIIPVALYALLAMMGGGGGEVAVQYDELGQPIAGAAEGVPALISPMLDTLGLTFLELPMISGVNWRLTNGDAILLLAMVLLFMEILKSTSTGTSTIMNHAVSMILFILCLVMFLLNANYATSTFFILMAMTLLDVLAGVVVTIISARRDFGVAGA